MALLCGGLAVRPASATTTVERVSEPDGRRNEIRMQLTSGLSLGELLEVRRQADPKPVVHYPRDGKGIKVPSKRLIILVKIPGKKHSDVIGSLANDLRVSLSDTANPTAPAIKGTPITGGTQKKGKEPAKADHARVAVMFKTSDLPASKTFKISAQYKQSEVYTSTFNALKNVSAKPTYSSLDFDYPPTPGPDQISSDEEDYFVPSGPCTKDGISGVSLVVSNTLTIPAADWNFDNSVPDDAYWWAEFFGLEYNPGSGGPYTLQVTDSTSTASVTVNLQ